MGFFDKIKSMTNAMTGGAAKVFVDAQSPKIGQPFTVTVRAQSTGSTVKFDRVYLYIRGEESVEVQDKDIVRDKDGDSQTRTETVRVSHTTFEHQLTVAPAGQIAENATQEWTIEVKIPENAPAPFKGKFTQHYYEVYAGLDCWGNDPDSGWAKLNF